MPLRADVATVPLVLYPRFIISAVLSCPVKVPVPATWSFDAGVVVPMPTLPAPVMFKTLSTECRPKVKKFVLEPLVPL
jgi:hypothetical protein